MTGESAGLRVTEAPRIAFVPAALLLVVVPVLMATDTAEPVGLFAIFAAFGVGVGSTALAVVVAVFGDAARNAANELLALGVSLAVAAVLLYLVFGCVFGCPG